MARVLSGGRGMHDVLAVSRARNLLQSMLATEKGRPFFLSFLLHHPSCQRPKSGTVDALCVRGPLACAAVAVESRTTIRCALKFGCSFYGMTRQQYILVRFERANLLRWWAMRSPVIMWNKTPKTSLDATRIRLPKSSSNPPLSKGER